MPVRNLGELGYSCSVRTPSTAWRILLLSTLVAGIVVSSVAGQTPAPEPVKSTAIKLPDGTVVFWTKNPDDVNPTVEGVVLSPQDYKNLVEQSEQARKAKTQAPSSVAIRGKIETRGERLVAALSLTYSFRTTQPRTLLILGCQRSLLVAAKSGQAKLPILNPPGDDGLTLLVDSAGEQTLTLDVEVPVGARGPKNELGFDLGLPRAAITTLQLQASPAAGIASVSLGTRILEAPAGLPAKPNDIKRFASPVEQLVAKPMPLGATDVLELAWEPVASAATPAAVLPVVESTAVVRVEETQVETVAKLLLRGSLKEWPLQLPNGAEVTVERVVAPGAGSSPPPEPMPPTVVRPNDPNKPVWLIRTPGDPTAQWLVTATVRVQRPKPNDAKFRGPYAIGPFQLLASAKQSGKIDVLAGPSVRLSFKPGAEFRRQDLPPGAPEDHIALFTFGGLAAPAPNAKAGAWLDIDARIAPTAIRVKASHQLKLTPGGWRLESTIRVTPPPRTELERVVVEIPAEWPTLEASPDEVVESIQILKDGSPRLLAIRFNAPQKSAFNLKLLATRPLPPKTGTEERESKLTFSLPRFPQADEREANLTATVPEGFEIRGSVALFEGGQPSAASDPLTAPAGPASRPAAIGSVGGTFDRAIARAELAWQPYRPALHCDNRVDVTLQARQLFVQQSFKFKPSLDDRRPIRLRGPEGLVGLQSVPPLDPVGPGLWEFRSTAEPGKEFTLGVAFALRSGGPGDPSVSLLWPESATRTDSTLRVWGAASGRRLNKFEGDWRELPNESAPDRDALPLLTLAASTTPAALSFNLGALGDSGLPTVWIERGYIRATLADTTIQMVAKVLLKRWLGSGLEMELPRVDHLELWVEGKHVEALPKATGAEGQEAWVLAVPLPEYKPGKSLMVEVRYRSASLRNKSFERPCVPPHIRGAVYRSPLRWWIASDSVNLVTSGQWEPDQRWAWRGYEFAPTPRENPQELEGWLNSGTETDAEELLWLTAVGGEPIAGRQASPQTISVVRIPKFGWIAVCSGLLFLVGLTLSYFRTFWLGAAIAGIGVGLAIAGAFSPQSLAQALSGAQAGAVLLAVTLATSASWRWYRVRRRDRLPGFSRDRSAIAVRGPEASTPNSGSGPSSRRPSAARAGVGLGSTAPPLATGG